MRLEGQKGKVQFLIKIKIQGTLVLRGQEVFTSGLIVQIQERGKEDLQEETKLALKQALKATLAATLEKCSTKVPKPKNLSSKISRKPRFLSLRTKSRDQF